MNPARAEVRYSSAATLRTPGLFLRQAWSDLLRAREPARHLFLRNLRSQHRQSVLGYLWLLLPPLATALVWTGLNYARVLPIGRTSVPYPLYVLCGSMLWTSFVESLKVPITGVRGSRDILAKVRVPHEAVILSGVTSVFFNFLIRLVLVLAALLFYGINPGWSLLLVPFGVLSIVMFGLAIGLWLAPLGLLYTDVSRAVDLVLGFGFLVTPIVYPIPKVWPASLISELNPLVPLLATTRCWLEGSGLAPFPGFYAIAALAAVAMLGGWLMYRVAAPHLLPRL